MLDGDHEHDDESGNVRSARSVGGTSHEDGVVVGPVAGLVAARERRDRAAENVDG